MFEIKDVMELLCIEVECKEESEWEEEMERWCLERGRGIWLRWGIVGKEDVFYCFVFFVIKILLIL